MFTTVLFIDNDVTVSRAGMCGEGNSTKKYWYQQKKYL